MRKETPILLLLQLSFCTIIGSKRTLAAAAEHSLSTRESEALFSAEGKESFDTRGSGRNRSVNDFQGTVDTTCPAGRKHEKIDSATKGCPGKTIGVTDESDKPPGFPDFFCASNSGCTLPKASYLFTDEEKCPYAIDSEDSIFNLLMFLFILLLNAIWWLDNGDDS